MSDARYGAEQADWAHFTLILGLEQHLLPCVSNPTAQISSTSALKSVGKIPSIYNNDHKIVGIPKWTERLSNAKDIATWSTNPDYGICIQTRAVRAFDCDITNEDLAAKVSQYLAASFPTPLPVRGRPNSPKFLVPFKLANKHGKSVLKLKEGNAGDKIEFLAEGQQFIAVGTHSSGVKYTWKSGLPYSIPEISEADFIKIKSSLKTLFGDGEWSDEASAERKPAIEGAIIDDPTLTFLEKSGIILGYSTEGSAYISCPFKSGHSKEGDITETVYFPAGLRGYQVGHFHCLHASCAERTDDDFLSALNYYADKFDVLPPESPETDLQGAPRFTFVQVAEYANKAPPDWIIEDILPKADLAVIFGESGSGKSFLALDQAFTIARGLPWNGKKVIQGRVAYVCAEGSGGVRARLKAYAKHHNISDEEFAKIPLTILADAPNLLDMKDITPLAAAINAYGETSVVFIDTLAQTIPGANENAGEDVGKAIHHCKKITKTTGALVNLVHHTGKDLTKGLRGSSVLPAAADAILEVSRNGKARNIKVFKQKEGEDGIEFGMTLLPVEVSWDDDDRVISSCVVEYCAPVTKKKDRVRGVIESAIDNALEANGLFEGKRIARATLQEEGAMYLPKNETGKDRRGEHIWRTAKKLAEKGEFTIEGDEVFITLAT